MRRIYGKRFVIEERLIQFGRELKASIEKLLKEDKSSHKQTEERMPKRPENRVIICYNCNEPGHISSRCPVKAKDRRRKMPQNKKTWKTEMG